MEAAAPQRIAIKIIKWVLFGAVIVFLIAFLSSRSGSESKADISVIQENVTNAADTGKMQEGDNRMLRRLYGIDPEKLETMVLFYPSSNMGAEELLFVRVSDKADVEGIKALIEQRNSSQIQVFEGYGPEQVRMLEEAVLKEYGRDLLYVSGLQSVEVVKAYEGK